MEMFWRRRAGAGLLRCRKARVHDGSARSKDALPFLCLPRKRATANHRARPAWEQMNATESLATVHLPLAKLGAGDACNVRCILAHYKYNRMWCSMVVRSVVHEGVRLEG
jgi:hypothetical protein